MPITSKDFLDEAVRVRETSDGEVSLRNASSRYYYGLFHLAKMYADSQGAGVDNYYGGTHAKLSEYFQSGSLPNGVNGIQFRKVSILLRQCHSERCRADYQLDETYALGDLENHILRCDSCIQTLEEMGGLDFAIEVGSK